MRIRPRETKSPQTALNYTGPWPDIKLRLTPDDVYARPSIDISKDGIECEKKPSRKPRL